MSRLFSFLFFLLALPSVSEGSIQCAYFTSPAPATEIKTSTRDSGILQHGEHLSDLILFAGAGEPVLRDFEGHAKALAHYTQKGLIPFFSEKIDGSPSIVAGFFEGRPFISYKGDMARKRQPQRLIFAEADVPGLFEKPELQEIMLSLTRHLLPRLSELDSSYYEIVFQGDLLFSEANPQLHGSTGISFKPNAIEYIIPRSDALYDPILKAKVGVIFHSAGRSIIDGDGKIRVVEPVPQDLTLDLVAKIKSEDLFVDHPFHKEIATRRSEKFEPSEIQHRLDLILAPLNSLPETFKSEFAKIIITPLRVFLNSSLRPDSKPGLYQLAIMGESFLPLGLSQIADFRNWYLDQTIQSPKTYTKAKLLKVESFLRSHEKDLALVLDSYAQAFRLQQELIEAMPELFVSKLGGVSSEGVMLTSDSSIVKLVDRLSFTKLNNQQNARGKTPLGPEGYNFSEIDLRFADLPHPFKTWRPDSLFIVLKGQPFHQGHIDMILETAKLGSPVFVIASDIAPNLDATHWRDLGAAPTLKLLKTQKYVHVFSNHLRRQLLHHGLGNEVSIHFLNPSNWFWGGYLARARELNLPGKVRLVMGQKEIDQNRYNDQLIFFEEVVAPHPMPMQRNGMSGTITREIIEDSVIIDMRPPRLQEIFKYVEDREPIIDAVLQEWRDLDELAQSLIQ